MIPSTECGRYSISYERPRIMGILNVTPDSFSDTVRYSGKDAVERIFRMEEEGADIIDVGGESTRPGSSPITAEEEMRRIIDVIKEAAPSLKVPLSADTMHPETAEKALDAGASVINDVTGLRDGRMMNTVASAGVPVVIMHMHGMPGTMQKDTMSGYAVPQISEFFDAVCERAADAGIRKEKMILDPGIGFGKTYRQNVEILGELRTLKKGCPLLIGTSMKSFLQFAYPNISREEASIRSATEAVRNGANIVRVHDIKGTLHALKNKIL